MTEQTGAEQGGQDPGTRGREAEDVLGGGSSEQPSQEEMRARLEEQLRNLRVEDLMVESVVSVLNLTARRIAKEDERDLEQGRVGIEAIRAWVELLPKEAADQIRSALAELQLLYANAAEGGGQPGGERGTPEREAEDVARGDAAPGGDSQSATAPPPPKPASAEPPPRLWTPPGAS